LLVTQVSIGDLIYKWCQCYFVADDFMIKKNKVHLSAFGIHVGGGLVLLQALLPHIRERLGGISLDGRLEREKFMGFGNNIDWVPKNFFLRLLSVNKLAHNCEQGEVLFCFNSLPPTVKCSGRVIVYVQAPHFIGLHIGVNYDVISRLRFLIERFWFRIGVKYVNEFWVQTESMRRSLSENFPGVIVRVMPFVDEDLAKSLRSLKFDVCLTQREPSVYFYPADGVGHKNHVILFKAWEYLAAKHGNTCPKLLLTLNPHIFSKFCSTACISKAKSYIVNLGILRREEVFNRLADSDGLIFASKAETFGLPLLEAMSMKTSILAPELDYIRDVCSPDQTFDPNSWFSIARAVERHFGQSPNFPEYLSASDIIEHIN
jgi:glycosyltransferase involved in cell wall biosynthesis